MGVCRDGLRHLGVGSAAQLVPQPDSADHQGSVGQSERWRVRRDHLPAVRITQRDGDTDVPQLHHLRAGEVVVQCRHGADRRLLHVPCVAAATHGAWVVTRRGHRVGKRRFP